MGLARLSPVAAQLPVDQQTAGGIANIYNLNRDAHVGGVEIHGPIDGAVTSQAIAWALVCLLGSRGAANARAGKGRAPAPEQNPRSRQTKTRGIGEKR
jgi:hypothetical protein